MTLSSLFVRKTDNDTILLLHYVNDMIITGDDLVGIFDLKLFVNRHFEMKDFVSLSYSLSPTDWEFGLFCY